MSEHETHDENGVSAVAADTDDINDCIARAAERAGDDNRAFVRYLNECYAQKAESALRLRGRIAVHSAAAAAPAVDRSPRAQQILNDERYLKNARELARRTQGGVRVIGGVPVPAREFLDCVGVGGDTHWGCTGTLIAPNVVVTAGHCASVATRVFFGSDVSKTGKIVNVKERHRHPEYRQNGKQNDLMILILHDAVTNIAPRPIAAKTTIDTATDGRVVGFGNTDPFGSMGYGIKRMVDVPVASPACQGTFDGEADNMAYGCDAGLEFVAGKPLLAKDSCTGDSGGPFYIEQSDGWVLAGATSRATNSAPNDCGDGGIYVRVDRYLDWIRGIPGVNLS
jgi:hypothetical protein